MFTVTGTIEDATGATLHATVDFISRSTPIEPGGGIVVTNTDKRIRSHPSDGTFSVALAAGTYTVIIAANGQSSILTITVPSGTGTATIDTLLGSPLVFTPTAPTLQWNGNAQNITFLPLAAPAAPTYEEISFTGGHINDGGNERYAYWVSWITATGQTAASPLLQVEENPSATPDMANRIFLPAPPAQVTFVNLWRSHGDLAHNYFEENYPVQIGLLATLSPSAASYDDFESQSQFLARVTDDVPPIFNSTAGQLFSSNGTICAYVTDNGLLFPGANCRIRAGFGLQVYNFDTQLWHTLLNIGNPADWGLDAGNPS